MPSLYRVHGLESRSVRPDSHRFHDFAQEGLSLGNVVSSDAGDAKTSMNLRQQIRCWYPLCWARKSRAGFEGLRRSQTP